LFNFVLIFYAYFFKTALIVLVLLLSSCLAKLDKNLMSITKSISSVDAVTGKREINFESAQKEITRAQTQTQELLVKFKEKGVKIDEQNSEFQRVKHVFNRLKKIVHRQELPWEIHLIDDKQWNAFTIGGGKVFVYTGIFKGKLAIQDDDELAAILAHEIAHVTARHSSEGQGKKILSKLLDKRTRSHIYQASFTTIQEDEADKFSVIYSALSGFNPRAGVNIWSRMHQYMGSKSKDRLHDHPLNENRAVNLSYYAKIAMRYYHPNKLNPEYQKILLNNNIFSYRISHNLKAGKGGGFASFLEVLGNGYLESKKAKKEQQSRK
jgi:predicted Zn-dependent protease